MTNFLAIIRSQVFSNRRRTMRMRACAAIVPNSTTIRKYLPGVLLFAGFFIFMAVVQFSTPNMPDNDGYYHIKMAYLMRTEGLKPAFPYLPLTILNARQFYDHHFLFHVALMPFTFGDLRLGAKWASVIFSSLAFMSIWWLLFKQQLLFSWIWALGLLTVSQAFIFRMSITRAQSLSLAILGFGLHLIFSGKHKWLIALGFVYVWLYNAFPLLAVFAGVFVLSEWLINRQLNLRPLIYSSAGILLGLLFNPYFPHNILFAIQHIIPKLSDATSIRVGNEWYPYSTGQLLANSPLALIAFISGFVALGLTRRKMSVQTATSFFIAVLTGLMLFQSRRFVEYFPAFALIFAAFAWSDFILERRDEKQGDHPSRSKPIPRNKDWGLTGTWIPAILILIILLPAMWANLTGSQTSINRSKSYDLFQGASAWLVENTPADSRVFQTDWDDFPRLFYYNTHNTYLAGLDPTYMQMYNPDLYETWVDISKGRVDTPSDLILNQFAARYIVTDLKHEGFLREAQEDPAIVEVYRDDLSAVFELR